MKYAFAIIVIALCLVAIVLSLCGCTHTALKRKVSPSGKSYTSFVHREFLMRSKMEEAEAVVDGDYRHYSIGTRVQAPDPNSIDAMGNTGVEIIKEILPMKRHDWPLLGGGNSDPPTPEPIRSEFDKQGNLLGYRYKGKFYAPGETDAMGRAGVDIGAGIVGGLAK